MVVLCTRTRLKISSTGTQKQCTRTRLLSTRTRTRTMSIRTREFCTRNKSVEIPQRTTGPNRWGRGPVSFRRTGRDTRRLAHEVRLKLHIANAILRTYVDCEMKDT